MPDTDGIEEAFEGALRTSLAVASRSVEQLLRLREEHARRAEAGTLQEARELQARLDAERLAARAQLAPVHEQSWWERAGVDDIARAYETAHLWAGQDSEAAAAANRIRVEVATRYGVDYAYPGAPVAAVHGVLTQVEAERDAAAAERGTAAEEREDARRLLEHAERVDRDAETDRLAGQLGDEPPAAAAREGAEELWDSAERRERHAAGMEGRASADAVEAWKQADTDNARHPREAVRRASGTAPKARRGRAGGDRELQRGRGR